MNHREQFHGAGRVLYKGGLCVCLALIGLLLGAPLGVGQSRGATLQQIDAEMRKLEQRMVQINNDFIRIEALRIEASKQAKAGGPDAELQDLSAQTYSLSQGYSQKEYTTIHQRYTQLDQERLRLLNSRPPPSSTAEAIAISVAQQNNLRHNINFLTNLEGQAISMAQICKRSGDNQGYIAWMKKKDGLTAQIAKYQGFLRTCEDYEKATRQDQEKAESNLDVWNNPEVKRAREKTAEDLKGMGKSYYNR
jgi:hypothetical protein